MEAQCYQRLEAMAVRCDACAHHCTIPLGKSGRCHVRQNRDGRLIFYPGYHVVSVAIDPIEKKPLYHFMPNSRTYSFATIGCNMRCQWCQNAAISQVRGRSLIGKEITPEEHVLSALKHRASSISYTYTEPTIFFEVALETMKRAKAHNLKNVWVSNGMMSACVRHKILPYLDAINIDLKSPRAEVYTTYCDGVLDAVIDNLRAFHQSSVHLEVTSLIIPGVNDSDEDFHGFIELYLNHLGKAVPWHISRFYPAGSMNHLAPTPIERLQRLKSLALKAGIQFVYLGNV